jgi:hypothetical protein
MMEQSPDEWVNSEVMRLMIKRLAKETCVTEVQASELVGRIGPNWSALIGEARTIQIRRERGGHPD